jgi:pyruvate/2-oxoglutarate dehydrogenase complex dihydrolipoamide dehydrogenase (E3) component
MGETQRYDAIVVGSAQAGTPLAKALARAGRKTAILRDAIFSSGGELMSMVEIAMMGTVLYTILRDAIFSHPTLAEALNNLFDQ